MLRNQLAILSFLVLASISTVTAEAQSAASAPDRPNVLFIAVDDLRPQLASFGKEFMKTPNFDRLAKRGTLFERAYCMVPTCGASRASLMTGLRPTPTRFVTYTARADQDAPEAIPLHSHFRRNGYTTASLGKVFHFPKDSAAGWTIPAWRPTGSDYQDRDAERAAIAEHKKRYPNRKKVRGMPYERFDAPDSAYRDHRTATKAIEMMDQLSASDEPFFLAVGFFKPHLPFCAPKRYWDLYDADSIRLAENDRPPTNSPEGAVHTSGELRAYATIPPRGPVDEATARSLVHGYYACVSFIDAQLGRLLDAIDQKGLSENTIIVLWGDHGWQLGEHGMWNKHSCFETSMHTPLFIATPKQKPNQRTSALVEFIDIYPTLCELCGVDPPSHLQGQSLVPQLTDPNAEGKPVAVGRYRLGDTIRTEHLRYSEYRDRSGAGKLTGRMLYDHRSDPNENQNIVADEELASTVSALSDDLNRIKGRD